MMTVSCFLYYGQFETVFGKDTIVFMKAHFKMEEGGDTESVLKSSLALAVREQIIVVSSLLNSNNSEELIKGAIGTLLCGFSA